MIKKRGKIHRGVIVMGSAGGAIIDLTRGMWSGGGAKRWLLPLAVFLCITGLLLVMAATVEVLAPFIYSIF